MNQKTKNMLPFLFIVIGSIITIVAAYFDYRNKLQDKDEQLRKEQATNVVYKSLVDKSNNLLEKTNSIILSQREVIDQITGEGKKPEVGPILWGANTIGVSIKNEFNYPISEVKVSIIDYPNGLDTITEEELSFKDDNPTIIDVGTIFAHGGNPRLWKNTYDPSIKTVILSISVSCRSGWYWTNIIFERNKDDHFIVKSISNPHPNLSKP